MQPIESLYFLVTTTVSPRMGLSSVQPTDQERFTSVSVCALPQSVTYTKRLNLRIHALLISPNHRGNGTKVFD